MICGSGRCLWDDVRRFQSDVPCDVMAVNHAGMYLPVQFHHWVSVHGEIFQWMTPLRANGHYFVGNPRDQKVRPLRHGWMTHSIKQWPGVDHVWEMRDIGTGSSGLFACKVAMALGYKKIVLCGVPLDNSGHFYDPPSEETHYSDSVKYWEEFLPSMRGRVFSMSGFTRELLGEP